MAHSDAGTAPFLHRLTLVTLVTGLALAFAAAFVVATGGWLLLIAGLLFGVLLDGLGRLLAHHTPLSQRAGVGVAAVALLVLLLGTCYLLGPRLASQAGALGEASAEALEQLEAWVTAQPWGEAVMSRVPPPAKVLDGGVGKDLFARLTGVVSTLFGAVTNVLIILVVGLYAALDRGLYVRGLVRLFPKDRRRRTREVLEALGRAMRYWLAGRFASMAVVGLLTGLGLWVAGVPLPLTLGVIAGLLEFIPYIGPILSYIPGVLVGLTVSSSTALAAAGVYLGVQFLESYVVTPLILKRAVELPPVVLLFSQVLLGLLFGLLGIMLAEPVAVAVILLVQALYVNGRLGDDVPLIGQGGD